MVKIINGEVVPDNDPRAQEWTRRQNTPSYSQNNTNTNTRARTSNIGNSNTGSNSSQQNTGGGAQQSPLVDVNNRLRGLGVPNFQLAGQVVEPVFTVAALLALVFWGFPGLLIVAVVWYIMTRQNQ